ncbi:hypothetical protein N9Y74_02705 [Alphaproteobacteria bacterium]|nr:hypothetical protein [Alphaproteobacteria bacterium]
MFIRVFFATAALFSISLFMGEKEAAACTIEPDGSLTLNNDYSQVCKLDPERMTMEVEQIGVCSSIPSLDQANLLASCQNVLPEPINVDLEIGKIQSLSSVRRPSNGSYGYEYRVSGINGGFKSPLMKFNEEVYGGDGEIRGSVQSGTYCVAPSYTTKFDYLMVGGQGAASHCSNSILSAPALTVVEGDNLLSTTFEPVMSVPVPGGSPLFNFDDNAYVNVVLLDNNNQLAASRETVTKLVLFRKRESDLIIEDATQGLEAGLTLSQALNVYVLNFGGNKTVFHMWLNANTMSLETY